KQPKERIGQLRVISAAKVGGRAQLVLAEVSGRKILLGVTDQSVNKLGWIEAEEEAEPSAISARPRVVAGGMDLTSRAPRTVIDTTPVPQKRSFRDFLTAAVGNIGQRDDDSAAVAIAEQTRDTFTRTSSRSAAHAKTEVSRRATQPQTQMVDVE